MPFEKLSDHFILRLYESIREEALAVSPSSIGPLGEPAMARAEALRQEIERRGLFCTPIEWPRPVNSSD